MELIESRSESDSLDDLSLLWRLRTMKFSETAGGVAALRNLDGGMGRLTDGMAALLNREVRLNTPVVAIDAEGDSVTVEDSGGNRFRARFVVCTIPLTVLRSVRISPALPATQARAVAETPYGHHTDVFMRVKEPFWEEDGLPASLWSNGALGSVLHMKSADPHGYLWFAIGGLANTRWRVMEDALIMERVAAELAKIRPSTVGRLEPVTVMNWSNYPWTRGHIMYMAPGQITDFGGALSKPHGRLHFAGEHTSQMAVGMEGAMESGERAALDILLSV